MLKQHSAQGDRYQDLLHNYLPNKGHFYITATLACAPEIDCRYPARELKVECVQFFPIEANLLRRVCDSAADRWDQVLKPGKGFNPNQSEK